MRRRLTFGAVLIALVLSGCSDDDDPTASPPAREGVEAPEASPGQLPPEFIECMADEGFEVKSSEDIHSAPPDVLKKCFGALHSGGTP